MIPLRTKKVKKKVKKNLMTVRFFYFYKARTKRVGESESDRTRSFSEIRQRLSTHRGQVLRQESMKMIP